MKKPKLNTSNIIFLIVILLLIIPQTRQPIQVFLHKGLALIGPSTVAEDKREQVAHYNWELISDTGDVYNFNEAQGKVVLINFWATWCPPCIAEMPSFQKLYDDYGKKASFFFVTTEKPDRVERFLGKHGYTFPVFLQQYEAPELLQSTVLPTTYVISKSGRIVIEETGVADWNGSKVRNLLDQLTSE